MVAVKVIVPGEAPIEFYSDPVMFYLPRQGETLTIALLNGERVHVVVEQVFHVAVLKEECITNDHVDGKVPLYTDSTNVTINARRV